MGSCDSVSSRLVDYIVVLELDEAQLRHGGSVGVVKQRFPENDWADIPFSHSIQVFCMPQGWNVATEPREPSYFVSTLTDLMGSHQYACCLQVYEKCGISTNDDCDTSDESLDTLYKPKVVVLLSRFPYFELFRACLNRIYIGMVENLDVKEDMIATLLCRVQLNGSSSVNFSFDNERISVRPPVQPQLPLTGSKVAGLVRNLGSIHNLLLLFRCVLSDQKIILHSSSLSRLSDSAYAIKCIIYPLEYTYTFVAVLPELLLEYLESPTPYLMGVLSTAKEKLPPVCAVSVNLDIGEIHVPADLDLPSCPSLFFDRLSTRLQAVLNPDLPFADLSVTPCLPPEPDLFMLDKLIRSCFLLFFAELLHGYRSCLEVVRLHKPPLIVFHKAAFMGMRQLSASMFLQLIDGQMFQLFISSRGLPYRECDIFDELVCSSLDVHSDLSQGTVLKQLLSISKQLYQNEKQELTSQIPVNTSTKHFSAAGVRNIRIHSFNEERASNLIARYMKESVHSPVKRTVSRVPTSTLHLSTEQPPALNSRRLLVLTACIDAIFDNRLSEARKMMCAVELSLRSVEARVALCRNLSQAAVPVTKATLMPAQFELVVRLLNSALELESEEDEHGIAYACLHLCSVYCRRLSPGGVHQFAYTCVQDHPVWSNHRFWEACFFHDVNGLLRSHYGNTPPAASPLTGSSPLDMWNLLEEPTSLSVAAERLRDASRLSEEELRRCNEMEESFVYGQAKHYINLMVYLRVPLDPSRLRRINKGDLEQRGNAIGQRDREESSMESDCESGYIENVNDGDLGTVVVSWISRLIDRLCSAAGLDARKTERLVNDIPGFVAVHIDNLEQVYAESRKIAPPPKTKLLSPVLLTPCERVIVDGLRCVLLPEERLLGADGIETPHLLPAEGAMMLTNYRIIFKGRPLNPFLSEDVVVRSVPVMSLIKEKSIGYQNLLSGGFFEGIPPKVVAGLHNAIQFRSAVFQLIQIIFDEEVHPDQIEYFTKTLSSLRWPVSLPHSLFAYATVSNLLSTNVPVGTKSKFHTIKEIRKTLTNPMKGSLSRKNPSEGSRLMPAPGQKALTQPSRMDAFVTTNKDYLDLSGSDSNTLVPFDQRRHATDYTRLQLKGNGSMFRITHANTYYSLVKSYPTCFVLPTSVSEDVLPKLIKGFRQNRLPVVTWINESGAFLMRGSALLSTNVLNKIKKQTNFLHPGSESASVNVNGSRLTLASKDSGESNLMHSSEYQEQYLQLLAQLSPSTASPDQSFQFSGSVTSLISLDSLITDGTSLRSTTPDLKRRSYTESSRSSTAFIRNSGGRPGAKFPNLGGPKPKPTGLDRQQFQRNVQSALNNMHRKNLYVLVEKGQAKILRSDNFTEFVPIVIPSTQQMKIAFKKLLRVMNPSWSDTSSFLASLDNSGWLNLVSKLLSLSNSICGIINTMNSSVALCIEDGWDVTCQLMSLSQLLLDPYYRTLAGFQILIEKEWLSFGHRFSYRANHTISSQSSGIAPVFLMFLDAVHQILHQFPNCFEFNDFYLRFLAYHSQSAFFRTFLLDSEKERAYLERMAPDNSGGHRGCIWNYIQMRSAHSPIFHNLQFDKESPKVLLPSASIAALDVWNLYTQSGFMHGSPYDIEIAEAELAECDERQLSHVDGVTTGTSSTLCKIDASTSCLDLQCDDGITYLIQTADRMNPLNEASTVNWQVVWENAGKKMAVVQTPNTLYEQHVQRILWKKSALRVLIHGFASRMSAGKINSSQSHHFEHYSASGTQPHICAVCRSSLYGTVVRTGQRCRDCGLITHGKCIVNISGSCAGSILPVTDHLELDVGTTTFEGKTGTSVSQSDSIAADVGESGRSQTLGALQPVRPVIIHQGYLSKKGATFKMWSPRWFVLEANSHKLSYYESEMDRTCRGSIDFCDVGSVEVENSGNKAILELRTNKRVYSLLADHRADAELWKEKIEHVLRE